MWATVGFVAMEQGSSLHAPGPRRGLLSGSNPAGVTPEEADELFEIQIGFITAGVARLHEQLNPSAPEPGVGSASSFSSFEAAGTTDES